MSETPRNLYDRVEYGELIMASPAIPLTARPLSERAFVVLNRRALDARRHPIVRLDDDIAALNAATGSRRRSQEALRQLIRDGRVRRIRRGIYLLSEATGTTSAPVLPLIDVITPRPYLVTAGRALAELGLSDQHFFRIVVLSAHRLHSWTWQGDEVRYALVGPDRIWGQYTPDGPQVAGPERAILDCLAEPGWGVTIPQTTEAIDRAIRTGVTGPDHLARAAERYGRATAARRLGYLLELLHGPEAAQPLLPLRGGSHARVLLSPSAPDQGPTSPTWNVRVNIDPEALLAHSLVR